MINKKTIQTIGSKEMDRKEFLKYSGLFLLSLVGFRSIISFLSQDDKYKIIASNDNPRSYGSGKYGK